MMQTDLAISISPNAMTHIARQLSQTGSNYLRLGVKESGCNGFMYTLDFLESPEPGDASMEFEGDIRLCVAASDLELVQGTEVDLITQGLNSAMVFKNPKATSYCGCGESFALGGGGAGATDASMDSEKLNELASNAVADQQES